jgi:hypothetical protein
MPCTKYIDAGHFLGLVVLTTHSLLNVRIGWELNCLSIPIYDTNAWLDVSGWTGTASTIETTGRVCVRALRQCVSSLLPFSLAVANMFCPGMYVQPLVWR